MKIKITAETIRQYAAASQDTADIHLNAEAAARAGYQRPIAHGMYLMGLAQSLYLAEHRTQWINSCSMKFMKPLWVDSHASFDFEVNENNIQVTVTADHGETIAVGEFTVKEGFRWGRQP
ncbi:hypothetical protein GRF59_04015 [Paenibacillus sp. HJL G12]|uniref:MaoC-like domain-containing protein n=1 Tax=Paenibacillus dendrobii TaxID=2691084 RepID=A0A7X3LH33_9BACL|nr:MaoC family dehydratase [Paenibacillus dendrobii]MWV42784.1 hypothetical protein [Paenibacillus dendrobii]